MPEVAFVLSPNQNWFYREFVETLRHELAEQGVPSLFCTDGFPEPTPERVYALVAPHEFVALESEDALPDAAMLGRTIFISAEQPGGDQLDDDIELSRDAGAVFSINSRSVAEFSRAGIAARPLRPGYSQLLDRFKPEAERDIDVLFYGALTRRRARHLAKCAPALALYNCCLLFSDDTRPNPIASSTFAAENKWHLLTRAKVVLNIHQDDEPDFEWLRALDAIHAGAVVVTEHSSGIAPLVAGEHLIAVTPESLSFALDTALHDPDGLGRMRSAAHERIRSWLPMALSVSTLRAAAVELVGRAVPANAPLGRRLTSESRLPYRWTPAASDGDDAEAAAIRPSLREIEVELLETRRQLARLEQMVRSGSGAPRGPEVLYESPGWELRELPRITVLTVLYNGSAFIGGTLDSVAGNLLRDCELIVVDDGSSDDSREMATEWMTAHPLVRAQLIGHATNQGLGAARNTGLGAARAAYCLVLDAGSQVYPTCIDALAWTLDSLPGFTFAYPMLEVFGTTETLLAWDGNYLRNALGWEPERLRLGNYIDAPSMIRTSRLRELGGFTTNCDLYGYEDYDVWCRMAERGWAGQLVPHILGRYRASASSIESAAKLSDTPVAGAVIERAPMLMAGIMPRA